MDTKTNRKMVDSGVEWIGEAPADWETYRLGAFFMKTKTLSGGSLPPGALSYGRVVEKTSEKLPDSTRITYQDVLAGDFLLNPINLNYDLKSLRTGLSSIDVCVSPAYIVMKRRSGCAEYLKYALHIFDIYRMKELGAGVRQTIGFPDIQREPIVAPSAQEQQAIANYLDHHVGLIDEERDLISKKIELLKDKRSALIFEVVTGKRTLVEAQHLAGVDDWSDIVGSGELMAVPTPRADDPFAKSGRLVDSGVEWIGEMPEGWTTLRIADVLQESNKRGTGREPVLSASQSMGVVLQEKLPQRAMSSDENKRGNFKLVEPGQFVVSLRTFEGGVEYAWDRGIISPAYSVCSLMRGDSNYYRFVFKSTGFIESLQRFMKGIRDGQSIPFGTLRTSQIPHPPLPTQQSIADFLDFENGLIDKEINLLTQKNELLSEQRKALIFEAVTGKIEITE